MATPATTNVLVLVQNPKDVLAGVAGPGVTTPPLPAYLTTITGDPVAAIKTWAASNFPAGTVVTAITGIAAAVTHTVSATSS